MKKIMIKDMPQHIGETVKLGAWLANKRSSGKIAFLQLRDGSGFVQGVVVKEEVGEEPCGKYLLVFDDKGTTTENKPCDCPTEYECECEVYDDELIAVIPLKRA